ncbi:MAG TPA: helix-hairpin-helix domain-containing protein [Phycisphaerae bacterium]|nr:helix-hairpin-helix domain-containing protein [Phycisphaerae bacterium]HOQ86287.1 helix-hairpin-helix domain-containing protein [Phycisphaerae bacterium]HQE28402.1 helix-hairpin-helix domain-containing protein [Phycisphaerae bacterium]
MPSEPPAITPWASRAPRGLWLSCYVLLGGVLVYALIARWCLPLVISEPIGTEHVPGDLVVAGQQEPGAAADDERIDPNMADWPELMRLPGIGEVMAKRIVEYRREHASGSDQPVFRVPEDLARVRGIGPKTVENLKAHLRFSQSQPAEPAP